MNSEQIQLLILLLATEHYADLFNYVVTIKKF